MVAEPVCPKCHGRLHVRVQMGTWTRCPDCFRKASSVAFIRPDLRGGATVLPPEIEALPPLPLLSASVVHPDPVFFRQWAWRSLLDYETRGLVYDYIDAMRLVEVNFNNDSEYKTLHDVQQVPLLLLDTSMVRHPHPYLGPVFNMITQMRQRSERPTWIYAPSAELIQKYFNPEAMAFVTATRVQPGRGLEVVAPVQRGTQTNGSKQGRYDPNAV